MHVTIGREKLRFHRTEKIMIIWEHINGEVKPKVFCDSCGWECKKGEYEEIEGIIICPNCIRRNVTQEMIIERE